MKIKILELKGCFMRVITEDDDVNILHDDILDFEGYGMKNFKNVKGGSV
jgi:hypothetical protein